jgi:hypothetical protein
MDVVALRRQGWTITDIAAEVGRHPYTVAKWLKAGGPPARRQVVDTVIDQRWTRRIEELLARNPNLLATSVYRLLLAEGLGPATRRGAPPAQRARPAPGPDQLGHGADRDPPGRGGAGRLVRLLRLGCAVWPGAAALLRGDPVLVAAPLLVVCLIGGPRPLAGGPGGLVRGRRRRTKAGPDRQHGCAGRVRPSAAGAAPAGAGVRRRPRVHVRGLLAGDAARKGKVERPFRELKEALLEERCWTRRPRSASWPAAPRRGWPRSSASGRTG